MTRRHPAAGRAAARRRDQRAEQAGTDLTELLVDASATQARAVVAGFRSDTKPLTSTSTFASGDPTPPVDPSVWWQPRLWLETLGEAEIIVTRFLVGELDTDFGLQVTGEQPFVQGLTARVVELIDSWSAGFKQLVARVVDDGHRELKSVADVSKDLRDAGLTVKRQADTIARTQMIGVSNTATHHGATMFAEPGDTKMWLATKDARVRDSHKKADGQVVPFDQPFIVGGHRAEHPGDSALPLEELVNCRCSWSWQPA